MVGKGLINFCSHCLCPQLIFRNIFISITAWLKAQFVLKGHNILTSPYHPLILHADTSKTVNDREQRSINHKKPHKFELRDKLYANNFHGEKWIQVTVTNLTGLLSYQVQTDAGIVLHRHVYHLRFCYPNDNTHWTMMV